MILEMEERNEERREGPYEEIHEGPHEERQEEVRCEEERNEGTRRLRNPRRMRDSPLDLCGEQHEFPILPNGTLKEFSGDGKINAKRHVDLFLDVCDFHLAEHGDVMLRLFLQTLSIQAYEWYTTFPTRSIGYFDDFKNMSLTMFSPPVTYHTLLTNFTQIFLKKNERIQDFNQKFNKTLNKILEDKRPNDPMILGCYKNVMPPNVKFSIRTSQIDTLE
jgi:hypothetical protein